MRTVDEFRAFAGRQWPRRLPGWLAAASAGAEDPLSWPLQPPTQAAALAAPDTVAAWASAWRRLEERPGIAVEWVERRWASLGRQVLPARVTATPSAVAELAGQARQWRLALEAVDLLQRAWPEADLAAAWAAVARPLTRCEHDDLDRLAAVLGWLAAHPRSGLWERELPVPGVDTKWFERHRALVEPLAAALTGAGTGLVRQGVSFRVRSLDDAAWPAVTPFSVPLAGLHDLAWRPHRVLISENLTSVATLPQLKDTVAVHGMGFAAPSLAEVGWIRDAEVYYWGDLDTYGFQILGRVREVLPQTRSVLMDEATLAAARGFAVTEPRPYRGEIGHLNLEELAALALLRRDDLRLEQERIPREVAAVALVSALG